MTKVMAQNSGCGLKMLYNQEAELVGSRQKMCRELPLHDLGYADDVALISDSMNAMEEVVQAINWLLGNRVNHQLDEDEDTCCPSS